MSTVEERVLETIKRHGLTSPGDVVLAAVSGGPDSVAMLHALVSLAGALKVRVSAAHLNHMLRGAEADADKQYVRRLCRQFRAPCITGRKDVARIARQKHMSIEQAARAARYEFLERAADRVKASRIAVAHTSDDQVETILLNLLRGTGSDGLAGMPIRRGRIIRPLLDVSRADVEEYCVDKRLSPRSDVSNLSSRMARNRIRNRVLPLLEKEQPTIRANLLRMAALLRQETDFLNELAQRRLARILLKRGSSHLVVNAAALKRADSSLRSRIIREAIRHLQGVLTDIEQVHVEAILALLQGHSGRMIHLPGPLVASYSQGQLVFSTKPLLAQAGTCDLLEIPGTVGASSLGIEIRAQVVERAKAPSIKTQQPLVAMLDRTAVREPVVVRTWQRGDRFHPLGAPGSMKLHDFFINQKVPRHERGCVPILSDAQGIIWVVGHRIDERCRVTERTAVVLRLSACRARGE